MVRAIRGAIQVAANDRESILDGTTELVTEVLTRNDLTPDDVISVIFSASRSGVAVKMTLITSSGVRSLRVKTSVTSSVVPSRIDSRSFAATWVAPRIALTT